MSTFAWIDGSADDRRRVLDAIEKLKETDSRDELGLATIRDGFSNELFPGTGTLQTRAAYFLFVPWMYQHLQRRQVSNRDVAQASRKEELRLIGALLQSVDQLGVIGSVARDSLKRPPSSIYWNGLQTWRIFERPLSIDEYHRQFEFFSEEAGGARDDDRQLVEGSNRRDWHAALPSAPEEFPRKASFTLRRADRDFLSERIFLTHGRSLLAWLLRHARTLDGDTPWEHPQAAEFPAHIQQALTHAQNFSDTMFGAPYLYNLMLAEKAGGEQDSAKLRYQEALEEWGVRMRARAAELAQWSLPGFWAHLAPLVRVSNGTVDFVRNWIELRGWEDPARLVSDGTARRLIEERERRLKGTRARLQNQRALELWTGDAGLRRLVYRWPAATRIIADLRPELVTHAES